MWEEIKFSSHNCELPAFNLDAFAVALLAVARLFCLGRIGFSSEVVGMISRRTSVRFTKRKSYLPSQPLHLLVIISHLRINQRCLYYRKQVPSGLYLTFFSSSVKGDKRFNNLLFTKYNTYRQIKSITHRYRFLHFCSQTIDFLGVL